MHFRGIRLFALKSQTTFDFETPRELYDFLTVGVFDFLAYDFRLSTFDFVFHHGKIFGRSGRSSFG